MEKNKTIKPKRKHTKEMALVGSAVLILCVVMLINSMRLMRDVDSKSIQADNLQAQITEQIQESEALVQESERMSSEEYIAQVARERLGLVKPNEIIFQKE